MSLLDDLKLLHQRDRQDAFGQAAKQHVQLKHDYKSVDLSSIDRSKIQHVVIAGMGGSALSALVLQQYPGLRVPLEIWRNYGAPDYIGEQTLFIASSYSGNTEETLDALTQAQAHGCQIAVVAAGGALAEQAQQQRYPLFELPPGHQPRMESLYSYNALVHIVSTLELCTQANDYVQELQQVADWLGEQAEAYKVDVPTSKNPAKQMALDLVGSSMVVYSGPRLFPAAYKWKISFNENAKNVAWCNQYPEFNHNEFLGWSSHPVEKPYKVIQLIGSVEHERVQKRFTISERLLSGKKPAAITIEAQGETHLQQLLWLIQYGDFVSLYVAILNGLDPSPVELIEKLKQSLSNQ